MDGNFSDRLQDVIRLSREEALRLGHDYIGTEHLLLGIIREGQGVAVRILRNLDCDLMKLKKAIEDTVKTNLLSAFGARLNVEVADDDHPSGTCLPICSVSGIGLSFLTDTS